MSALDILLINFENIAKGAEFLAKGKAYVVAYDESGEIVAYSSGGDTGKQLMDMYLETVGTDKNELEIVDEHHKDRDGFTETNYLFQICIVDRELMLKRDVEKLLVSEELLADKNNRKMWGLDRYTRK